MVDGGVALEERIRVGGDDDLMDEGKNEAWDCEIELQVAETVEMVLLMMGEKKLMRGGRREGMVGPGGVGLRGFEEIEGNGDDVVEAKREQRRRRENMEDHGSHCCLSLSLSLSQNAEREGSFRFRVRFRSESLQTWWRMIGSGLFQASPP